jgi:transposase
VVGSAVQQLGGLCPADAGRTDQAVLYASLELGYRSWLLTALLPGTQKLSKRVVVGGDANGLVEMLKRLAAKSEERVGGRTKVIVVQEVGLDGFWIHRMLEKAGVESWLVDPASVAVPRRHRRVKTDKIDGEALVRVLMAFKRGEPRVCAMVVPPSPAEEDRRRLGRERSALLKARVQESNRIKGLLLSQGIRDFRPLDKDRRAKLGNLRTGDGRTLPPHLKDEIARGLDRLELILSHLETVEAAWDDVAEKAGQRARSTYSPDSRPSGPHSPSTLWTEAFYRSFDNRRQLAAYTNGQDR